MKHINLSNYKGSITDWTILNYVKGGLADNLADIVNIKVNDSCYNYLAKSQNLIKLEDMSETTKNGITYKVENGLVTLNGTATQATTIDFVCNTIDSGIYSICWFNDWTIAWDYFKASLIYNASYVRQFSFSTINASITSISAPNGITKVRIYITGNPTFTNAHFRPMLVKGTTAPTAYEPYGALVIHQNAGIVDLGTLTWIYRNGMFACYDIQTEIKKPTSDSNIANISCSKYETQSRDYVQSHSGYCGANMSGTIVVNDSSFEGDAEAFKAAMSGVMLKYELANPTIIVVDENGEIVSTTTITRTANTLALSNALELDNTTDEVSVEQDSTNEIEIEEES